MKEDDPARIRDCSEEVLNALIATLDDLKPRMMEKYNLDQSTVESALLGAASNAGLRIALSDTNASEEEIHTLSLHMYCMLEGFTNQHSEPDGIDDDKSEKQR
jgi:hypothetical protein